MYATLLEQYRQEGIRNITILISGPNQIPGAEAYIQASRGRGRSNITIEKAREYPVETGVTGKRRNRKAVIAYFHP